MSEQDKKPKQVQAVFGLRFGRVEAMRRMLRAAAARAEQPVVRTRDGDISGWEWLRRNGPPK